jgi:Peroxidase, family 2
MEIDRPHLQVHTPLASALRFLPGPVLTHHLGLLNSLSFVCVDFRRQLNCEYAYRLSLQRYSTLGWKVTVSAGDIPQCPYSRACATRQNSARLPHLCGNRPNSRSYRCLRVDISETGVALKRGQACGALDKVFVFGKKPELQHVSIWRCSSSKPGKAFGINSDKVPESQDPSPMVFIITALRRILRGVASSIFKLVFIVFLFSWDISLVLINLITCNRKVGKVTPKGQPGAGGVWPEYIPPQPGDSRSSCPALNAMANHGLSPFAQCFGKSMSHVL